MTELWAPVGGYGGLYSVSNLGRIRRDGGGRGAVAGRILTPKATRKGYRHVDLSRGDVKTRRLIHQLVAGAFLGPRPSSAHHPNHLDGDKTNNAATNLEWATAKENSMHAVALGLYTPTKGEANGRAKLTERQVMDIRGLRGKLGQRLIAQRYEVSRTLVQRIHQGMLWPEVRQYPGEGSNG